MLGPHLHAANGAHRHALRAAQGEQSHCEFRGERLRQWQWEIDRGARVKIGVGRDYVVVMGVWTGHPKENE